MFISFYTNPQVLTKSTSIFFHVFCVIPAPVRTLGGKVIKYTSIYCSLFSTLWILGRIFMRFQ